jgi:hypothetical protein
MDDFLHNLRSGKLKQQAHPKRQPNGHHSNRSQRQPTINRRNGNEIPTQLLNAFRETLGSINTTLKDIADKQESLARIEKRNTKALETIADGLQRMFGRPDTREIPMVSKSNPSVDETKPRKLSDNDQEAVGIIIRNMRSYGDGWEKIGRTITALGYPTVSGRGKWRGVLVKNLYEKLAS